MPAAAYASKTHAFLTTVCSALRPRSSCHVAQHGLRRVGRVSARVIESGEHRVRLPLHTLCRVCCNMQPDIAKPTTAAHHVPVVPLVVTQSSAEVAVPAATASSACTTTRAAPFASSHTLHSALFGLTDMHTSATTHVSAAARVGRHMPLLEPWVRAALFEQSGWLTELTRAETTTESSDGAAARRSLDSLVGRPKLLRVLLLRFLRSPELWRDFVAELVERAAEKASADEAVSGACGEGDVDDAATEAAPRPAGGLFDRALLHAALRHLEQPANEVMLYGPGLTAKLERLLTATEASFVGPCALWDAFVLTRRHDTRDMPLPQCAPFSFSEVIPTIAPVDLELCPAPRELRDDALLRCDEAKGSHASAPHEAKTSTAAEEPQGQTPLSVTSLSAEAWAALDAHTQNTLLFGKDGADYAQRVRGYKGLHVAYHANMAPPYVDKRHKVPAVRTADDATKSSTPASSSGAKEDDNGDEAVAEDDEALCGEVACDEGTRSTPRERYWARRVRLYDTDRHYLGLIESLQPSSPPPLLSVPAAGGEEASQRQPHCPLMHDELLSGARVRNAVSGEVEDIQLARLWARFRQAETSELIDNYLAVHRRLSAWRAVLRHELAVQRAFLLLFWARDEVRAVTKPAQSYASLWTLHDALTRVFRATAHDTDGSEATSDAPPPPFAALAAEVQVTYSCFGWSHLPQLTSPATSDAEVPPSDVADPLAARPTTPVELYARCAARYADLLPVSDDSVASEPGDEDKVHASREARPAALWQATYEALNPLQRFAVDFCFADATAAAADDESVRRQDDEDKDASAAAGVAVVAIDEDDVERQSVQALVDEAVAELVYPTYTTPAAKRAVDMYTEGIVLWLGGSSASGQPTPRGRHRHAVQHC